MRAAFLFVLTIAFSECTFLGTPKLKWMYQLSESGQIGGRGLKQGNAVQISGSTLYVSADDGSLHLIDTESLDKTSVFVPEKITGAFTECRSGISFSSSIEDEAVQFIVYAVIDTKAEVAIPYGDFLNLEEKADATTR